MRTKLVTVSFSAVLLGLLLAFSGQGAGQAQLATCCAEAGCCTPGGDCCCVLTGGECCLDGTCDCDACLCCVPAESEAK